MKDSRSVEQILFDKDEVLFAYMYDLRTNRLLAHGCVGWVNTINSMLTLSFYPFPKLEKLTFDEAVKKCEKNDDVQMYINVDKNIKMVIIPEPK